MKIKSPFFNVSAIRGGDSLFLQQQKMRVGKIINYLIVPLFLSIRSLCMLFNSLVRTLAVAFHLPSFSSRI